MVYKVSDKILKNRVYCNEYSTTVIGNLNGNMKMRFENDNRIPIAGKGMVNFGFDQNFRINGGMINGTDDYVLKIVKDGEQTGNYRYISHNGNWFIENNEE